MERGPFTEVDLMDADVVESSIDRLLHGGNSRLDSLEQMMKELTNQVTAAGQCSGLGGAFQKHLWALKSKSF